MSFSAEVMHMWVGPEELAPTLRKMFEKGCCTVWSNEEFVAAIPCTNEEADQLADLMDVAVVGIEEKGSLTKYMQMRDRLCGEMGYQRLSLLFKIEMDKQKKLDEARERGTMLASSARASQAKLLAEDKAAERVFQPVDGNRIVKKKRGHVLIDIHGYTRDLTLGERALYVLGFKGPDDFKARNTDPEEMAAAAENN